MNTIPRWISGLTVVVLLILVFKMYSALFSPALAYGAIDGENVANQKVLWELAGRDLAMIVVTALALRSQDPFALLITMVINVVRESFDMMIGIRFSGGDPAAIGQAMSFLIFLVPYGFAIRALRARRA